MDLVWCLKRVERGTSDTFLNGFINRRDFLDRDQYQKAGVLATEMIFGKGGGINSAGQLFKFIKVLEFFISKASKHQNIVGGKEENAFYIEQLKLQPGDMVLDVGCGIGGNLQHMAQVYI